MNILITGGSGFLGKNLTLELQRTQFDANPTKVFWASRKSVTKAQKDAEVITYADLLDSKINFDVIINLAGAGIADGRWSEKRKKYLIDSRLNPTHAVLDYIANATAKPKLFITGSAIGWYGTDNPDSPPVDETSLCKNPDFSHQLCNEWERLALEANNFNLPVAIIRTGVVLAKKGGMIDKLKLPFSLGLGGKSASGKQFMSWISLNDWIRAVIFIIKYNLDASQATPEKQIYNLTNPKPATNLEITKAVGKWLKRPTLFPQPKFLLKLMFGEMSCVLTEGQKVLPRNLQNLDFEFEDVNIIDSFK